MSAAASRAGALGVPGDSPPSPVQKTNAARRRAAASRQRAALGDRIPTHVAHCYHRGARDWWIYTWKKSNASAVTRVPYQCASWRCDVCRKHDANVNYARFQEAASGLDREGWCFLTLTVPRHGFQGWETVDAAYKALSQMSRNFNARLKRWMVRRGWYDETERVNKKTGKVSIVKKAKWSNQWIGVVEAHRSGWPHMHFALWSPELAEWLRDNPEHDNLLCGELQDAAEATGWGNRCTLEPARSRDKVASYLMKLSGEVDALVGEVAKMTQLPTVAPVRFRRVRAGKNFLPPRKKNPEYTGTLLRRRPDESGVSVEPIHRVEDCPVVAHLCAHEEDRAMHAHWTKTAEKPVDHVAMPKKVVDSYHGRESGKCDGGADCGARGPGSGAREVLPGDGPRQAAPGLASTTSKEQERWARERRRADEQSRQLTLTGVNSATPTSRHATTTPTRYSAPATWRAMSSEQRPPVHTLQTASTTHSKERLSYSVGGGGGDDPPA